MMQRAQAWRDRLLFVLLVVVLGWSAIVHFRFTHVDYNAYHRAGTLVLAGQPSLVYAPEQNAIGGFLYPAFSAVFFAGFAFLGEWGGRLAFYLLLLGSVVAVFAWAETAFLADERLRYRLRWVTLLCVGRSVNDVFLAGNINALLAALAMGAFVWRDRLPALSLSALASAVGFKVVPLFLASFWAWERRFLSLLALGLGIGVVYLVPFLILGHGVDGGIALFEAWRSVLSNPANYGDSGLLHFQNLSAMFTRYSDAAGVSRLWVRGVLVLSALLVAGLPYLRGKPRDPAFAFAVAMAWVPLLSPVSWYSLGVFYVPLVYWTASHWNRGLSFADRFGLVAFFTGYTLLSRGVIGGDLTGVLSFWSIPTWGALALVMPATCRLAGPRLRFRA